MDLTYEEYMALIPKNTRVIVKDIIKLREPQAYDSVWKNIDTLEDLCLCDGAEVAEENIVLGEDWFISYIIDGCISIENWIALDDNENKLIRLGEMFAEIKNILLLSNELDTDIVCYMRHNTSYQFYLKYKKRAILMRCMLNAIFQILSQRKWIQLLIS